MAEVGLIYIRPTVAPLNEDEHRFSNRCGRRREVSLAIALDLKPAAKRVTKFGLV
jgi:hypothetical protein